MSPRERWSEADVILDAALAQPPEARRSFIATACRGDTLLRRSVERLLELAEASGDGLRTGGGVPDSLGDRAPGQTEASDVYSPGARVEHYEIVGVLGRGGMGTVYRARDHELGREVAVKVLSTDLAGDARFMQRFRREARVLAALNHPNIAALYELLEIEGRTHLVLELVEGETLKDRLSRGPLTLDGVLPLAVQIAEGVAEAHSKGIVHRDLKPANVRLTREGRVKIVDLGLAKDASKDSDTSFTTASGVLLGTAPYMSPEQVRGDDVDERTDIWAFGCVLYEMLTGRRAFAGRSVSDILASVLRDDVDWDPLPRSTPRDLRRLLERCLRKDPRRRLRDIGDAALELAEAPGAELTEPTVRGRSRWLFFLGGGAVGLAGALTAWALGLAPAGTRTGVVRSVIPLSPAPSFLRRSVGSVALSPDGRQLVYASAREDGLLHVRPMEARETTPLPGTEGAEGPFFSPDGEWIGFAAGGELRKRPLSGGPSVAICDVDVFRGGSWGPEGAIVFGDRSGLRRVSASGGTPENITRLDPAAGIEHLDPTLLPGGEAVVFTIWHGSIDTARVAVQSLGTGSEKELLMGASARPAASGHLVFARRHALWAVRFDARTGRIQGDPYPVVDGVQVGFGGTAQFTVAVNGTLAYFPDTTGGERRLVLVDRQGQRRQQLQDEGDFAWPRFSPDGRRIAVHAGGQIWVHDLERQTRTRLTTTGENIVPVWTPDGQRLTFASSRSGPYSLFWKILDGGGDAEPLLVGALRQYPGSWTSDGRFLSFHQVDPARGRDVWVLPRGESPRPVVQTPFEERAPALSPEGRWLAYVSDASGRDEVYVQEYPSTDRRWIVSSEGGTEPVWSRDGRELFYRRERAVLAVSVRVEERLELGRPEVLFEGQYDLDPGRAAAIPNYDVSPEGQQFVMVQRPPGAADVPLHLVVNWFEEIEAR